MHGFMSKASKPSKRTRQSSRRRFRGKLRAATVRACTAARLHLGMPIPQPSIKKAATMTGSNSLYVAAMVVILKSEDSALLSDVVLGEIPILKAAAIVETKARLIAAYREASVADRVALVKAVGAEEIFDKTLVPAL
jgi:hypothetical protein